MKKTTLLEKGHNSLREFAVRYNKSIIEEWVDDLNFKEFSMTLDNTTYGSHKKAYFKCKYCGKVSLCNISDRTLRGSRCGVCASANQTSYPEQLVYYIIKEIEPNTKSQYILNGYKFDVCIEDKHLLIEYNSRYTHAGKNQTETDDIKQSLAIMSGYTVFTILDDLEYNGFEFNSETNTYRYKESSNKLEFLHYICCNILSKLGYKAEISKERLLELNQIAKEQSINKLNSKTSLLDKVPDITKEWAYDLNGNIRPEDVSYGSNKKYWFRCENGHTYEAKPKHKSQPNPTGCKICHDTRTRNTPLLQDLYPELAIEYSKNNTKQLNKITYGSTQRVNWKCPNCGYEFNASVNSRTYGKHGCKRCGYNWFKLKTGKKQEIKHNFVDKSSEIIKLVKNFVK